MEPNIDWTSLSDEEFEQLCYDLLIEMGFDGVGWRRGTTLPGRAADSGRDIECTLRRADPDDQPVVDRWFVQAKHYARGVPPAKLEDAMAWAAAERPDVLLIAASGFLSNPAKDWIAAYQRNNRPSFRIVVWERPHVERLLARYPTLMAKYFGDQDPVLATWNGLLTGWRLYGVLAGPHQLQFAWDHLEKLELDPLGQQFLVRSELSAGTITTRDWLTRFGDDVILGLIPDALFMIPYELQFIDSLGLGPLERKTIVGELVRHLVKGHYAVDAIAQRLWEPERFLHSSVEIEKARAYAQGMRALLTPVALAPSLEMAMNSCRDSCGVAEIVEATVPGDDEPQRIWRARVEAANCKLNVCIDNSNDGQEILCPALFLFTFYTIGRGYLAKDALGPGNPPEAISMPMEIEDLDNLHEALNACRVIYQRGAQFREGVADFPQYVMFKGETEA